MKYIRIPLGIFEILGEDKNYYSTTCPVRYGIVDKRFKPKTADTIEELIQVGDIIKHYDFNAKRYEYFYIHDQMDLEFALHYFIVGLYTQNCGGHFIHFAEVEDAEAMINSAPFVRQKLKIKELHHYE